MALVQTVKINSNITQPGIDRCATVAYDEMEFGIHFPLVFTRLPFNVTSKSY